MAIRLSIGSERGERVTIVVDGSPLTAFRGETVAAALLASGRRSLRRTWRTGSPRGLFCAMGVCFDCVVTINERTNTRSCITYVEEGMQITTGGTAR